MASSRTDLTIHLQRARISTAENDDVIRISRGSMYFEALYWDGETKRTHRNLFSRTEILSYFSILMSALVVDVSPFDCIQIMANGFPSIVYSISDIEAGTPGWAAATSTLKWFVDGQWSILPAAPFPGGRYLGTTVPNAHDSSFEVPEFVPSTARVSLQPQWAPLRSSVLVAVESPPTVTS